jgi:hypothetical protein
MTHVERRKHANTFHMITWFKKQLEWKLTALSCSEPSEVNRGARLCCEHLLRLTEEKRRSIIQTNEISRR